ncbi:MAG: hypothetical protein A2817_03010 [Candidatus Yanofskybacteria bacterium RIFCSPHIGHO2_01_FULL_39_8b]|uniref:Uncharacterized protein n=1 Tax=Candidatus Yanofskybacteria bacterium RIFCSPHIGHO2_01_FULL_39_8b TaxID=1802659 RepID=A0A1F8EEV6_9BACT|nr:MAG: hypothetical protein A2817_03010 [Candidatus Yanofskybacteria bacterium RIFCSPHIGHO2_01_FULL_39_8b]
MRKTIKSILMFVCSLFLGGIVFAISALVLTIMNLYLVGHSNIRILSTDLPIIGWSLSDLLSIILAVFTVIIFFRLFLKKREKIAGNNSNEISNIQ